VAHTRRTANKPINAAEARIIEIFEECGQDTETALEQMRRTQRSFCEISCIDCFLVLDAHGEIRARHSQRAAFSPGRKWSGRFMP
jgi:hypothetical protein